MNAKQLRYGAVEADVYKPNSVPGFPGDGHLSGMAVTCHLERHSDLQHLKDAKRRHGLARR